MEKPLSQGSYFSIAWLWIGVFVLRVLLLCRCWLWIGVSFCRCCCRAGAPVPEHVRRNIGIIGAPRRKTVRVPRRMIAARNSAQTQTRWEERGSSTTAPHVVLCSAVEVRSPRRTARRIRWKSDDSSHGAGAAFAFRFARAGAAQALALDRRFVCSRWLVRCRRWLWTLDRRVVLPVLALALALDDHS